MSSYTEADIDQMCNDSPSFKDFRDCVIGAMRYERENPRKFTLYLSREIAMLCGRGGGKSEASRIVQEKQQTKVKYLKPVPGSRYHN